MLIVLVCVQVMICYTLLWLFVYICLFSLGFCIGVIVACFRWRCFVCLVLCVVCVVGLVVFWRDLVCW